MVILFNEFLSPRRVPEPFPHAGVWSGPGVSLRVDTDGAVFGVFADEQLYRAQITHNRTWLTRALNLRTEYIITGQVGQHRFQAPFNVSENRLDALFFIQSNGAKIGPANIRLKRRG